MLVNRGVSTTSVILLCLLLTISGSVDAVKLHNVQRLRQRASPAPTPAATPVAPVAAPQFKQQSEGSEFTMQAAHEKLQLENQLKLLDLQQKQHEALLRLKEVTQAREQAETQLLHKQLVIAHAETSELVTELESHAQNKMLVDLQRLYKEMARAMMPHLHKLQSSDPQFKQTPSGATGGSASTQKQILQRQLTAKAEEVVDAQLESILGSDELAYIQAHNAGASSDASSVDDSTEVDTTANPGESPDDHLKRLMNDADKLMAQAYPAIKCGGGGGGSSGAAASSGGSTGSSTGAPATPSTGASSGSLVEASATAAATAIASPPAASPASASAGASASAAGSSTA